MAKTTFNMADGILTPCNVACGSEIVTVNSPSGAPCSGMTFHWIRPNVRHIGILLLVLILTVSPQSTCHSGPVWEILSKSDHPRQKKSNACLFSRWRISAILDFRGPIMGSLKSPRTTSYRVSIDTIATRGVQKVLQLDHKEEWKCYKLHFIFQYNHRWVQCICDIFLADF